MTTSSNRNWLTVFFTLSLMLNLLFLGFAYVQKVAVDESRISGEQQRAEAQLLREEIDQQRALAEQSQKHAAEAMRLAQEAHEQCEAKLKTRK